MEFFETENDTENEIENENENGAARPRIRVGEFFVTECARRSRPRILDSRSIFRAPLRVLELQFLSPIVLLSAVERIALLRKVVTVNGVRDFAHSELIFNRFA